MRLVKHAATRPSPELTSLQNALTSAAQAPAEEQLLVQGLAKHKGCSYNRSMLVPKPVLDTSPLPFHSCAEPADAIMFEVLGAGAALAGAGSAASAICTHSNAIAKLHWSPMAAALTLDFRTATKVFKLTAEVTV